MMAVEPETVASGPQNLSDALERLRELHEHGDLTEAEYSQAKAAVVGSKIVPTTPYSERDVQQWAMLLHLSQLLVFVVPPFGLVVPFVIWQLKKADMPELDMHGKAVANWILSELVYFVVSMILFVTVIGIVIGVPLLLTVIALAPVFPIIGAVKASHGYVWRYPLSIRFIE